MKPTRPGAISPEDIYLPASGLLIAGCRVCIKRDANNNLDLYLMRPDGTEANVTDVASMGGAPSDGTYLVTTGHAELSDEIVVGATPGGQLGGSWASPTLDTAPIISAVEGEATLDLEGDVTIAAEKSLSVDTILETTPGLGITIEGALLQHFTQLQEIATPANPGLNYLRLFARASGENIQLIALSSQGAEAVLATLDDTAGAHTNTLALNWIE